MSGGRNFVRLGKGTILAVVLALSFIGSAASAIAYGQLGGEKPDASVGPSASSVPPDEPMVGNFYATGPTGVSKNPLPTVTYNYNWSAPSLLIFYTNDGGISWTSWGNDLTCDGTWVPSTPLPSEGIYYFSVYQSAESVPSDPTFIEAGPYIYDLSPPTSSVDPVSSYWFSSSSIPITATATDSLSSVSYVELWYKASIDNSTWGFWQLFGNDTNGADGWSWDFTMPAGERHYQLGTRAGDVLGNRQPLALDTPWTYKSKDTPKAIPNLGAVASDITVPDAYLIGDVNVMVNISHPNDMELRINVSGPSHVLNLYMNEASGANFYNTTFDDEAADYVSAGSPPYIGSYKPTGPGYLSDYDGHSSSSQAWRLNVNDVGAGSSGTLRSWSLVLTPAGQWPSSSEAELGYRTEPFSAINPLPVYWYQSAASLYASATPIGAIQSVELWYSLSADNVTWGAWTICDIDTNASNGWSFGFPFFGALHGWWRVYTRAHSYMGIYEAAPSGYDQELAKDDTSPTSSVAQPTGYWHAVPAMDVAVNASDNYSGVSEVDLSYSYSSDNSSWSAYTPFGSGDNAAPYLWSFNWPSGDGYYRLVSAAGDRVGNWESAPASADAEVGYDTVPPSSSALVEGAYAQSVDNFTINATASDATAGVAYVDLFYRQSEDNSTWSPWMRFGRDYVAPWQWTFDWPRGWGNYEFATQATDNGSCKEAAHASADVGHSYSPTHPTTYLVQEVPIWRTSGSVTLTPVVSSWLGTPALTDIAYLYYRYSPDNATWGNWTAYGSGGFSWSFSFPDGQGFYQFYTIGYNSGYNRWEPAPFNPDVMYGLDSTSPSSAMASVHYWQMGGSLDVSATATDPLSGIAEVEFYYQWSDDNATWTSWALAGSDTSAPYTLTMGWAYGTGYYRIGSLALDNAGNDEGAPGDMVECAWDNEVPTSSVDTVTPYWLTGYHTFTASYGDWDPSWVGKVEFFLRRSTDNSTWGNWTLVYVDYSAPFEWYDTLWNWGRDGYYQLYSIATDKAGNREGWAGMADAVCGYDASGPNMRALFEAPYVRTTSPLSVNGTGGDFGPSGVNRVQLIYEYSVDNSTWDSGHNYTWDLSAPWQWSFNWPSGAGYYRFKARGVDNAGNWQNSYVLPFPEYWYNPPAPSSNVTQLANYWLGATPQTLTGWCTGVPATYCELWYDYSADNATWSGYAKFANDTNGGDGWSWSFTWPSGGGWYRFYSRAGDAISYESAPGVADASNGYDVTAPTSSIAFIAPYWRPSALPLTLGSTASDGQSGIERVEFYYQYASDNSTWGSWTYESTDFSAPYQCTFSWPNGNGYYRIASRGMDRASNIESLPAGGDVLYCYDTDLPSSSVNAITPYWHSSAFTVYFTVSDGSGSGVNLTWLYYRYASDNSTWGAWTQYSFLVQPPWQMTFDPSLTGHGEGHYQLYTVATDRRGNVEAAPATADAVCGYDTTSPTSSVTVVNPYWRSPTTSNIVATASDSLSSVSSVELWYRFSANNASWGTWTMFGTDTASPWQWTFTWPSGDGYYEFYSRAHDAAGNYEAAPGARDAAYGYDATKPTSTAYPVTPYFNNTGTITVHCTASDALSGVKGVYLDYQFSTDNVTWVSGWTNINYDTTAPYDFSFNFGDGPGYYEFRSWAEDAAGNAENMPSVASARCCYDDAAPSSAATVPGAYTSYGATRTVNATASDAISGVSYVTLRFRWSTDNSSWGGWTTFSADTAAPWSWSFNSPNGTGYYEFYTVAVDKCSNAEAVPASADASCRRLADTTPPTSSVTYVGPYWVTASPLNISWTVADAESTISYVELWYRQSADNATWGAWTNLSGNASAIYRLFAFPSGQGFYQFYTRACDASGNYEAAPATADAAWAYDTTAPVVSVTALPAYVTTLTFDITVTATDAGGVSYIALYYTTDGGATWTALPTHYTTATISFTASSDGTYGFYAVAYDLAGNHRLLPSATTAPDTTTLVDTAHPTVTSMTPSGTNVSVLANVTMTFSEPMNTTSVQSSMTLPTGLSATYTWDSTNTTLTIHFTSAMPHSSWMNTTLGTGAKDVHGLNVSAAYTVTFRTTLQPVVPPQYGSIKGNVVDENGAPIQGVTVTLGTTGITATTDANGDYAFSDVAPGTYTLSFSCAGYDPNTALVTVTVGQAAVGNATMPASGSGGGGNWMWIAIILVIVAVAVVLVFLMKMKGKGAKADGEEGEVEGKVEALEKD